MCDIADIEILEARWRLGLATDKEMEDAATDWLVQGCDSATIVNIAARCVERSELSYSFGIALGEVLGRDLMSCTRAGWIMARHFAAQMLSGDLLLENGAEKIDALSSCAYEYRVPEWLMDLYYVSDDPEYLLRHKPDEYRARILEAANELMALPEPDDVKE